MPYTIDLGGAPTDEACAQLGHTPDFDAVNRFEVSAYKLAIIARFGMPPDGCRLAGHNNLHDFGAYRTLVLTVADNAGAASQDYAERVQNGLRSWMEACFTPPVTYDDAVATIHYSEPGEMVVAALKTTRPHADGSFAVPDFKTVHNNLATAFPAIADQARGEFATGDPQ